MESDGPVYFRITRYTLPTLFDDDHTFEWGKGKRIREGTDVSLFGTGMMTGFCLEAAQLLAEDGVDAEVIHLASIKPIDRGLIADSARRTGCAVTTENATIVGGFGSAVAEVLGETVPVPLARVGVRDRWVESGGIDELFAHHRMRPNDIAAAAREVVTRKAG
jgi:transketolase